MDWLQKKFEGREFGRDWLSIDLYWVDSHTQQGRDLRVAIDYELAAEKLEQQ